ncbi:NAD-binding protein [Halobium salinum]|uniref:NAD-binding protein n=1 Tax=Halobium salinum TaxID=1364940 RepID=A0ABD5PH33_9EURY|nr:NAD(P)-binding protein [Halobium salinum]
MNWRLNRTRGEETGHEASDAEYHVLGGGPVGASVARRLRTEGYAVSVVDESHDGSTLPGLRGDPTDVETLREAGLADASTAVVASRCDGRNLLIAQLARTRFEVPEVVVLANVPNRYDALAAAGHEVVCATNVLSGALAERV